MKKFLLVGSFALVGCMPKVMVLQSPVISMKKNNTEKAQTLSEGKAVDLKWCSGDKPIVENDDGSKLYGLIDQVVLKAHQMEKADFFVNNRFYMQGGCMWMQANVGNISGGGGAVNGKKTKTKKAPHKEGKS